jgi:hypothetical protein
VKKAECSLDHLSLNLQELTFLEHPKLTLPFIYLEWSLVTTFQHLISMEGPVYEAEEGEGL